jgi:hypothetical protein
MPGGDDGTVALAGMATGASAAKRVENDFTYSTTARMSSSGKSFCQPGIAEA